MNKFQLKTILEKYKIDCDHLDNDIKILNIESNLQISKKHDLVFYKINDDEKSKEIFKKRLALSSYGVLIASKAIKDLKHCSNILVLDENYFLEVQKVFLDHLFPNLNKLKLVGVTGTNGKTSTVNLAMQISHQLGKKAASLGTIGLNNHLGPIKDMGGITTPSYVDLRKIIYQLQVDYEVLFFEVSSHSLKQDRLFDLKLDLAAWTNFTQDHLDYHHSMEDYFKSKCLIVTKYLKKPQDCYFLSEERELFKKVKQGTLTQTIEILYKEKLPRKFNISFNRKNLELALNLCFHLFGDVGRVSIERLELPPGRFSLFEQNESLVIIDYAHTPDALFNICKAMRDEIKKHKLIVIFGCGGDRDRTKRPQMAQIAYQYADKLILTNDNPRYEDEKQIMQDMLDGLQGLDLKKVEVIFDRKKAIEKGMNEQMPGSALIIAGKGHEDYQDIKGVKHPYSDFVEVVKYIS